MKVEIISELCDYFVIRGTKSIQDGYWYERSQFPKFSVNLSDITGAHFVPNGMYEVRNDGEVAIVFIPSHTVIGETTHVPTQR